MPKPPADLDLRLVRYFTVVADHEHFGRAAEALHLAQPSLSRQIRRLEQQLGACLIDRGPRGSTLTEAGQVFLPRAHALLHAATQAAAGARAAAEPSRITVGYTSNLFVTSAVRELRRSHPHAETRTVHLSWDEPHTALLDHRVDVAVARLPFPTDQLLMTVLYDEPRVLVVPLDHRLAGAESVTLDDIVDEPLPRLPDQAWNSFWCVDPRPDGSRAPEGPQIQGLEDKLELIADGRVVSIGPAGVRDGSLRPDLTTIPLEGVEPGQVVLATRADDRSRLVAAFREVARARLTGSRTAGNLPGAEPAER